MKFKNKKIGKSICLYILTDKMDPYTLAIYELVKSFGGMDSFNLSIREMASYRKMSYGKAQKSFKKLLESGIVRVSKKTAFFESDEYEICDEWLAYQMDPNMEYNQKRKSLLDAEKQSKEKKK